MRFSNKQVEVFRKRLIALEPPKVVLEHFDRLVSCAVEINSEDELEDLLVDACRIVNWTKPWEPEGQKLSFRARLIGAEHSEFHADMGGENSPAVEQAFRRGVSHGIARARQKLSIPYDSLHELAKEQRSIDRWRQARLQSRSNVVWGSFSEPDYSCKVRTTKRRSGLSLRKRWAVLERDNKKCVVCGASAGDGVELEVDHIKPVSKGGSDELENLQTLCFDCNRGKADQ